MLFFVLVGYVSDHIYTDGFNWQVYGSSHVIQWKPTSGISESRVYPTSETHINEKSYNDEATLYVKESWTLPPLMPALTQRWKYLSAPFAEKEAGIVQVKCLAYGDMLMCKRVSRLTVFSYFKAYVLPLRLESYSVSYSSCACYRIGKSCLSVETREITRPLWPCVWVGNLEPSAALFGSTVDSCFG